MNSSNDSADVSLMSMLSTCETNADNPANAVAICDAGLVDCAPLCAALERFGVPFFLTSHRLEMLEAGALIIPDGPSFDEYVRVFSLKRLAQIIELRIAGGRPVLACGSAMHMLCDGIDRDGEFTHCPAPQWNGTVVELPPLLEEASLRVPISSPFLLGVEGLRCEVLARYALRTDPAEGMDSGPLTPPRVAWVGPPTPYVAAIDNGALCATAWAPEKAGELGVRLLGNWLTYAAIAPRVSAEGKK